MAGNPVPVKDDPNDKILCIGDLRVAASRKLPESARDFYNSGSTDQISIFENASAYRKYRVRPRVLVDVSRCDPSTICFGKRVSFPPLGVSPAGLQAMAHPEGELATARACARRSVNMAVSSFANYPIKQIRDAGLAVGPIKHAMQMYTMKDRNLKLELVKEAERNGCTAMLLTADSPVLGVRYKEWWNDFRTPAGLGYPIIGMESERLQKVTHDSSFTSFNDDGHH